jgi:hypothetical protein
MRDRRPVIKNEILYGLMTVSDVVYYLGQDREDSTELGEYIAKNWDHPKIDVLVEQATLLGLSEIPVFKSLRDNVISPYSHISAIEALERIRENPGNVSYG